MASAQRRIRALARASALAVAPPLRRLADDRDTLRRNQTRLRREVAAADRRIAALEFEARAAGIAAKQYEYLFIISYGRSGSTLLQGILCSTPGLLIRGENGDAFHQLLQYQRTLQENRDSYAKRPPPGVRNPWYGIEEWTWKESLAGLRLLALQTVLHPEPDTRVIGFKEIRWWYWDWRDYLRFMRELFPGARFIINTRDIEKVAQSSWWTERDDAVSYLAEYESRIPEMVELLGAASYRVHFDDYIADPGTLAGLYEWLGEPFDRAAVEAVIDVRHSF